ncbi:hypothetical protein [Streptomyces nanshensis]|uniref:Uncharacterized protein n=1 Tax=Streptomyces nanshensis TaxID=518642 RepID=A0A1E7LB71_9ACTN|nr:hypothetical protein [Streptomyces nanshensis]OEV13400.1 hypothetical protein AN218_03680 [Streptomyces nanshensis]
MASADSGTDDAAPTCFMASHATSAGPGGRTVHYYRSDGSAGKTWCRFPLSHEASVERLRRLDAQVLRKYAPARGPARRSAALAPSAPPSGEAATARAVRLLPRGALCCEPL